MLLQVHINTPFLSEENAMQMLPLQDNFMSTTKHSQQQLGNAFGVLVSMDILWMMCSVSGVLVLWNVMEL